jgi:hypothetical protein
MKINSDQVFLYREVSQSSPSPSVQGRSVASSLEGVALRLLTLTRHVQIMVGSLRVTRSWQAHAV